MTESNDLGLLQCVILKSMWLDNVEKNFNAIQEQHRRNIALNGSRWKKTEHPMEVLRKMVLRLPSDCNVQGKFEIDKRKISNQLFLAIIPKV